MIGLITHFCSLFSSSRLTFSQVEMLHSHSDHRAYAITYLFSSNGDRKKMLVTTRERR